MPISAARFDIWKSFDEEMMSIIGPYGGYTHVQLSGEAIEQRRLFAAAPDLLAALRAIVTSLPEICAEPFQAGRMAIEKATGEWPYSKAKGGAS